MARSIFLIAPLLFTLVKRSAMLGDTPTYERGLHSVAYVTVPSEEVAKELAYGLISNKLAASVSIIPELTSVGNWEGKIQEDTELLLMIKTKTSYVKKLTDFVRSVHPYDVFEVINLSIENGNEEYLKWMNDVLPEK